MPKPSLPDIKRVNVNHKASWQSAVSLAFRHHFRKHYFKNLLLSIVTLGVFAYKQRKKARKLIAQALSARKLLYFTEFQDRIESVRSEQNHADPRQALNAVFMRIQTEKVGEAEEDLEFKAIYAPAETFLFITNPVREKDYFRWQRLRSRRFDYLNLWHELKKKSKVNQYRQIQSINLCNKILKEEFCLTSSGVHDRLARSSIGRKSLSLLTKFRELSKAFQEIVLAYRDFEELQESNLEVYHLLKTLSQLSQQDIETLQTYLASRYLPRDLPLANRRQLIQLGNQQEVLYHIIQEQQFKICALILNHYQWEFLLSIQEVSEVTLNLIDWAFEESPGTIKSPPSFVEKMMAGINCLVKDQAKDFPLLSEKINENSQLGQMTVDFARELHREWPPLHFYDQKQLSVRVSSIESATIEHLIYVYLELRKFVGEDSVLFGLLQQAISQTGKAGFQSAIEDGMMQLLGEKPEYLLPVLTNADVSLIKDHPHCVVIRYTFEQVILKKGERQKASHHEKSIVITQPLEYVEKKWTSPEPKVEIVIEKRMP
ncbi:MAG: hypothetical protein AAF443_05980 [Chlamydiota bacterium]